MEDGMAQNEHTQQINLENKQAYACKCVERWENEGGAISTDYSQIAYSQISSRENLTER